MNYLKIVAAVLPLLSTTNLFAKKARDDCSNKNYEIFCFIEKFTPIMFFTNPIMIKFDQFENVKKGVTRHLEYLLANPETSDEDKKIYNEELKKFDEVWDKHMKELRSNYDELQNHSEKYENYHNPEIVDKIQLLNEDIRQNRSKLVILSQNLLRVLNNTFYFKNDSED